MGNGAVATWLAGMGVITVFTVLVILYVWKRHQ